MLARSAASAATRTRSRTLLSRRFSSVPVVDLGAIRATRSRSRGARVDSSSSSTGRPEALRTRVLSLARSFFARPQAAKDALSIRQSTSWRGYQRVYENVTGEKPDAHEALDLYSESPRATHHRGTNLWPDAEFEAVYIEYVDELLGVGRTTMRHFSKGLGLRPDYFDRLYDASFWCMRAIHYPDAPEAEPRSEFGCGAHTDYGCLTLLLTDERRGALQARNGRRLGEHRPSARRVRLQHRRHALAVDRRAVRRRRTASSRRRRRARRRPAASRCPSSSSPITTRSSRRSPSFRPGRRRSSGGDVRRAPPRRRAATSRSRCTLDMPHRAEIPHPHT